MRLPLAAALLFAASCAKEAPPRAATATMDPRAVTIREGAQGRLGSDLTIGAGNFWDEGGQLTCALWISPAAAGERVHQGQVLERGGHRLEVVEIARDGGHGVVVLREL